MSLLCMYAFAIFLVLLLLFFLNLFLIENGLNYYSREENSSYECGFEHNSLSRVPFSVRYFLLTVVFLVFDMEVALMTFLPFSLSSSIYSVSIVLGLCGFVVVLFMGLMYEWVDGSLDWIM